MHGARLILGRCIYNVCIWQKIPGALTQTRKRVAPHPHPVAHPPPPCGYALYVGHFMVSLVDMPYM